MRSTSQLSVRRVKLSFPPKPRASVTHAVQASCLSVVTSPCTSRPRDVALCVCVCLFLNFLLSHSYFLSLAFLVSLSHSPIFVSVFHICVCQCVCIRARFFLNRACLCATLFFVSNLAPILLGFPTSVFAFFSPQKKHIHRSLFFV